MPIQEATSVRSLQAQAAAARRWKNPNQDEISRDYAAARIAAYIDKVVAEAPPLTDSQRDRIAALLRPVGGGVND